MEKHETAAIKQHLVTKSNALIEANYRLTLTEQKIILYLVSRIRKEDNDFETYVLPIREFCELMGLKGSPKYTEIRKTTKDLMSKVLEIKEGKKLIQIGWLSYVEYNEQEGQVSLSFDPRLKPYLLQLKREFTSYRLKNILELNSTYAIRMYEILKKWQTIKEIVIPLNDLKKMVGADEKYSEYHNFKKRVLKPAEQEIQEKTDIMFTYSEIKKGRKVVSIKLMIQPKQTGLLGSAAQAEPQTNELNAALDELKEKGYVVSEATKKRWFKLSEKIWDKNPGEHLVQVIFDCLNLSAIRNYLAFITHVLNEKYNAVLEGKKSADVTPFSLAGRPVQGELLPSWFTRPGENEEEEFDESFYEEKKRLEEELKKRKHS